MERKVALKPTEVGKSSLIMETPGTKPLAASRPLSTVNTPELKKTPEVLPSIQLREEEDSDIVINDLKVEIKDIEFKINEYDSENDVLKSELNNLETELVEESPVLIEKDKMIKKIKIDIEETREEIEVLVEDCRKMLQDIKKSGLSKDKMTSLDEELEREEKELQDLYSMNEKKSNELEEMQNEIEENQQEIQLLMDEVKEEEFGKAQLQLDIPVQMHLNKTLHEENSLLTANLEEYSEVEETLEEQLHEIITSDLYMKELHLQTQFEDELIEENNLIEDDDMLRNRLYELDEEINSEEQQNEQLMQEMISYGQAEGFDCDGNDMSFEDYLNQLQLYLKQKNRPQTTPLKKLTWEDEETELNELLTKIKKEELFKINKVNGQYEIQLLVDPSQMDVVQLLDLFSSIDELGEQLQMQKNEYVQAGDDNSEIYYGSEHDTIDPVEDDYEDYCW